MIIDFEKGLAVLSGAQIQFIVVGGVAATLQGLARVTLALDVGKRKLE